jgi:DNA-binding MarR family transcriptional regulator
LQLIAERGSVSIGALGTLLDVDKSTVSKSVTRLEEKGLIERERAVSDRREKSVSLTSNGRKTTMGLGAVLFTAYGDLLEKMPRTDRKRLILAIEEVSAIVGGSIL